jgi:hypothetical protein
MSEFYFLVTVYVAAVLVVTAVAIIEWTMK